jgi:hypothetical protein
MSKNGSSGLNSSRFLRAIFAVPAVKLLSYKKQLTILCSISEQHVANGYAQLTVSFNIKPVTKVID